LRKSLTEQDRLFVEKAFENINPHNLRAKSRPLLASIKEYFEMDGCLSEKQVKCVKDMKLAHDKKEREKRSFNRPDHSDPMSWLKKYDPVRPKT
jgi:SUMO ligase MMS21 Smc5/6 complex component